MNTRARQSRRLSVRILLTKRKFGTGTACLLALLAALAAAPLHAADGELELRVIDKETGDPIAARMHLVNQRGRSVIPKGVLGWKDHFVFAGTVILKLPPGEYRFEIERGPEYALRTGTFSIKSGDRDAKQVDMQRFVNMAEEGWWSGDLHVHRSPNDIRLLMLAEDLHVAPVITWWNDKNAWEKEDAPNSPIVTFQDNRFYDLMAGEDERGGGALLYFGRHQPLPIQDAGREYPSSLHFLKMAKSEGAVHVDVEKPFWWDLPLWLASGLVDSIGIAHNHMWRDGVLGDEAWGKPRDTLLYPGNHGNGRWTQDIYYHVLNSGLRVPPSAGSASGVLPNPVGYNRVYVYVPGELSYERWWEALRAGRVVVTNGPMLRPLANGQPPGHVFTAPAGETVELQISLELALREKVEYLQIVRNGKVEHEVRLDEYAQAGGQLPPVEFKESGWVLVRAITNNPKTYRFASSGPFYVEIGGVPRISRASAQFFLDWVYERARALEADTPEQKAELLEEWRMARDFWKARLDAANQP